MLQPRIARSSLAIKARCNISTRSRCRTFTKYSASCKNNLPKGAVVGQTAVPVDEDGIPLEPSYSIKAFLASLPNPTISDEQFVHLHKLAALLPPSTGTPEFIEKKKALEEMVRLVEGVRPSQGQDSFVEHHQKDTSEIPDGRIWPEGEGIQIDWSAVLEPPKRGRRRAYNVNESNKSRDNGKEFLDLASQQVAGYYVVKKRQAADVE